MLAQLRASYVSGLAQFRAAYVDEATNIVVVTDIESGNIDPELVVVTDPSGASPTIWLDVHSELGAGLGWRHFFFALESAEGRTPIFRINRDTKSDKTYSPTVDYRPVWTQDFVTWHRAPSRTLVGGSTGYIQWQFTEPMPSGRVYIADHALGLLSHVEAFAAELLDDYPGVAAPAASADASGVFHTSPAENDHEGNPVGGHPMFAIRLSWPGPTTDGARKRRFVGFSGIHSAGEAAHWPEFVAAVRWMLDDASSEAQAFRANWDVWLYFALTPNGLYSGTPRTNAPARTTDPNRVFVLSGAPSIDEIAATCAAAIADTAGKCDAFFSWHCHPFNAGLFIPGKNYQNNVSPGLDAAHALFITTGETITGHSAVDYGSTTANTDAWWGQAKLGAKIAFHVEIGTLGTTDVAQFEAIGRAWVKTLQAVDAQGLFLPPIELAGASIVATTSTGSITTGIPLLGAASSITLAEGALIAQIRLQVDAIGKALAAAGLTNAIRLAAAAQSGAQATGTLTAPGAPSNLEGHAVAQALASGSITTVIRLDAGAVASVLATGELTVPGSAAELQADATVLALATGGLTTAIPLQGAAASVVQASGTLDLALTFDAQAFASVLSSGVLSTQVRLNADAVAGALASASLTASGAPLAAHGARRATFRGYQRPTMRRTGQRSAGRRPKQYA